MKKFIISLGLFIPILFFMGCDDNEIKNHIIAKIPEASGISYCENSDTLVVANDEGKFYEIDKNVLHPKSKDKTFENLIHT